MLTSDFADWMAYLVNRVASGGVIVEPFSEAYNENYSETLIGAVTSVSNGTDKQADGPAPAKRSKKQTETEK